ncbi:hypothetical protein MFUL124B02_32415 [Myxococcus fulvus 124B02]|nr:hypothetical protein MFUL124B02_32415 [Myxococcus fulvus 124B02]
MLALSTSLLGACNGNASGGGGGGGGVDEPGPTPVPPPPEPDRFAEPTSARDDVLEDVGGFYDVDAQGQPRAVRHDLTGSLPAMVQFAQSHTVDPSGNEARNMPRLTAERAALLLVTPDPSLGELHSLRLTVLLDGVAQPVLLLRHPNELYRSDANNSDGRKDYNYSRRAWSVHLPWDWVKPGMSLRVMDPLGRTGILAAEAIDFAAPAELVVQSIRLGMLTEPPEESNDHWFLRQPAQAAADYFQTIPAARITVGSYEPMQLARVMVANGTIYDTASVTNGDVYSGDMRENTGKSTVSVGINLANFGATASSMQSQEQPQLFQHVLAHHNVGMYANGRQSHGLSGGNGMLTVYATSGNEFSHEIGHHYGLGHYPGEKDGNHFWAGHHHDSGWGYIAYRKRMRANLNWTRAETTALAGMPSFEDTYAFGTDAMSGGHFSSALSRYTHYTGYSTRVAIQPALDRAIPRASSSTGYVKWSAASRKLEEIAPSVPDNARLFFNVTDGKYRKPRLIGVPVFTVLGGYNPETGSALLYPAFRGNWGNVFDLPEPQAGAATRQCWLEVSFASGPARKVAMAGSVLQAGSVNKLHVNLAQADKPTQARLMCQAPGAAASELAAISIAQDLPAMPAPVVIGQEAGYAALRAVELPEFEALLLARAQPTVLDLGTRGRLLHASYADDPTGLSSEAAAVLARYEEQESKARRLNRWMNAYRAELQADDNTEARAALEALLKTLGLDQRPRLPAPQQLLVGGNCVKVETVDGKPRPYIAAAATCTGAPDELWLADANGSIRSNADLSLCLGSPGGHNAVTLSTCDRERENQVFDLSTLPQIKRNGACLDMSGGRLVDGRAPLITYGCSGGGNQRWTGLTANDNLLPTLLSNSNLGVMRALETP